MSFEALALIKNMTDMATKIPGNQMVDDIEACLLADRTCIIEQLMFVIRSQNALSFWREHYPLEVIQRLVYITRVQDRHQVIRYVADYSMTMFKKSSKAVIELITMCEQSNSAHIITNVLFEVI